jgi:hypothetical protein
MCVHYAIQHTAVHTYGALDVFFCTVLPVFSFFAFLYYRESVVKSSYCSSVGNHSVGDQGCFSEIVKLYQKAAMVHLYLQTHSLAVDEMNEMKFQPDGITNAAKEIKNTRTGTVEYSM